MGIKTGKLKIDGMHCSGCEDIITAAVSGLPGIRKTKTSYRQQTVDVEYDNLLVDEARIRQAIEAKGYGVVIGPSTLANVRHAFTFLLLLLLVGGVAFWGKSQMPGVMQQIQPHMGLAVLFSIGFLTGFHCIGMCGGFVVGYTDASHSKARQVLAHLSYGFGKTLSYAALGAGFGLLGSAIAITPQMRGGAALAASVFLLLYGLKMLNVFSALRYFTLRLPKAVNRSITSHLHKHRSPLLTGLLTGLLLGCGPLQAMYVMAAGSGDLVEGATILLMFSLGTLLPLLGFGLFASLLSSAFMRQLVRVSGILVIAMGLMMAGRGLKMLEPIQAPSTMAPHMQQPR
ncbi:MAG: sulfite exporter TauE/SafE family protein [Methylovulum miyakonense]|uniref:urease accessory protein UreH domain-containing protein n=1 Tax=Methylovulum miyakonense TaxID=645578 RepID=UPI003BB52E9D